MIKKNKNIFKIVCICILVIITLGEIFIICVPYINKTIKEKDVKVIDNGINNQEVQNVVDDTNNINDNKNNNNLEDNVKNKYIMYGEDEEDSCYISYEAEEKGRKINEEFLNKCNYKILKTNSGKYRSSIEVSKPSDLEELKDNDELKILNVSIVKLQNKILYVDNKEVVSNINKVLYTGQFDCGSWMDIFIFKDDGIYLISYDEDAKLGLTNPKKISDNLSYVSIAEYWIPGTCGAISRKFFIKDTGEYISISDNIKLDLDRNIIYTDSSRIVDIDNEGILYYNGTNKNVKVNLVFEDSVDDTIKGIVTEDNLYFDVVYSDISSNNKKIRDIYYKDDEYLSNYIIVYEDETFKLMYYSHLIDLKEKK